MILPRVVAIAHLVAVKQDVAPVNLVTVPPRASTPVVKGLAEGLPLRILLGGFDLFLTDGGAAGRGSVLTRTISAASFSILVVPVLAATFAASTPLGMRGGVRLLCRCSFL